MSDQCRRTESDNVSLHIRLASDFFTHRKTYKLKSMIGTDAYWIPIRLWTYASASQPDGDMSKYTPEALREILGYQGDASGMLQALIDSEFVDKDMKIHDWHEHNAYHALYAQRASAAAKARWAVKRKKVAKKENNIHDRKGKEQALLKHCLSIACSMSSIFQDTMCLWVKHRFDMGKPPTKHAIEMQFDNLKTMGEARAVRAIRHSIANGWQGIFEEKGGMNGRRIEGEPSDKFRDVGIEYKIK